MMRFRLAVLSLVFLLLSGCCGGPDPVRHAADTADQKLFESVADRWFRGVAWTVDDERLVRQALADRAARLAAEAQLLGGGQ